MAPQPPPRPIRTKPACTIAPTAIQWLWRPYIPLGKLTMLVGDPGLGKTWLSCALAAHISRGRALPGEPEPAPAAPVLYLTAEDDLADTLAPRLRAVGANTALVELSDDSLVLGDLRGLEAALAELQPRLLVLDPLQAYLGAGVDMGRANEVRPLMAKLRALAARQHCAMLLITHLRKSGAESALYRGLGSIDFAAAVRSVLLVGRDPDNADARVMVHTKASLAAAGPSVGFAITEGGYFGARFEWRGFHAATGDDFLGLQGATRPGRTPSKRDEAMGWLARELQTAPPGGRAAAEIATHAQGVGITAETLKRAKRELGVHSAQTAQGWYWSLPPSP